MATIALEITLSKDAKSVQIKDTTLDYVVPPSKSLVRIKPWKGTSSKWVVMTTPVVGQIILATDFGYTLVIPDGVFDIEYVPMSDLMYANYTTGSVDVAPVVWPGPVTAAAISYIYNGTSVYELDWTLPQTTVLLKLKTAALETGAGLETMYGGTINVFKALNSMSALACIVGAIAASTSCGCSSSIVDNINQLIRWKFAADIQFECQDYQGAHELITNVNQYCECP